jgi:hypothetical protein
MRSLRLSPKYYNEAKKAFLELAVIKKQLAAQLGCSRQPISNFFNGKPVASELFIEICRRLKLDWKKVSLNYQDAHNSDENAQQSKARKTKQKDTNT